MNGSEHLERVWTGFLDAQLPGSPLAVAMGWSELGWLWCASIAKAHEQLRKPMGIGPVAKRPKKAK